MFVTMAQIDRAREELLGWKILANWTTAELYNIGMCHGRLRYDILDAEETVEHLLRGWWAQGCTEGPRRTEAQWYVDQAEASLRDANTRAEKVEAQHLTLKRWEQSALSRLVAACGGPASGGHDMVDEIIGLLRVTRGQRDDAEHQLQQWKTARDDAESRARQVEGALLSEKRYSANCLKVLDEVRTVIGAPRGTPITDAVRALVATKPPVVKVLCPKCSDNNIFVRWVPPPGADHRDVLSYRARCEKRDEEHLHHTCRTCGFEWCSPTQDAK